MHNSLGRMISILYRQSQIYISQILKEYSVTSAEYFFLFFLFHNDGISQDELSALLYIDKSATTRALKSLEEKNYVRREKDKGDKRLNRVFLTKDSLEILPEMKERVHSFSSFLTSDLDDETEEMILNTLNNMTEKIKNTDLIQLAKEYTNEHP